MEEIRKDQRKEKEASEDKLNQEGSEQVSEDNGCHEELKKKEGSEDILNQEASEK